MKKILINSLIALSLYSCSSSQTGKRPFRSPSSTLENGNTCINFLKSIVIGRSSVELKQFGRTHTFSGVIKEGLDGHLTIYKRNTDGKLFTVKEFTVNSRGKETFKNEKLFYSTFGEIEGIPKLSKIIDDKRKLIVTEYTQAQSYNIFIAGRQKLNNEQFKEALHPVLDIAITLKKLHRSDVLHLDIRPENIQVDQEGHGTLTNFASTLFDFRKKKIKSTTNMSIKYKAPEVEQGKILTEKSDVYSLGIVLRDLLSNNFSSNSEKKYGQIGQLTRMATAQNPIDRVTLDQFIGVLRDIVES